MPLSIQKYQNNQRPNPFGNMIFFENLLGYGRKTDPNRCVKIRMGRPLRLIRQCYILDFGILHGNGHFDWIENKTPAEQRDIFRLELF